jgi:hypothetical protein
MHTPKCLNDVHWLLTVPQMWSTTPENTRLNYLMNVTKTFLDQFETEKLLYTV